MLTAVTSKFRDIIGQNTYVPQSRKRTLDESSSDEDFLGVGLGEPVRKKSRPLAETEEPIIRSYSLSGNTVLKGTAKRLSTIWSWMSSFISPSFSPEESLGSKDPFLNDIQYMGASQQTNHIEGRPAINRKSLEIKRELADLTRIDAGFRFSPSITSTAAKSTLGNSTKSLLNDHHSTRKPITRTIVGPSRVSKLLPTTPIKRLYSTKYSRNNDTPYPSWCFNPNKRGKSSIHEAFRHEDKLKYQKLLKQFNEESSTPFFTMSKVASITSTHSSSRSSSPQSIIFRSHRDSKWTKDNSKRILSKPASFSSSPSILDSGGYGFGKKLFNGGALYRTSSNTLSSTSTKESDNDCIIIAEDIKVRSKKSSLEKTLLESPVFDEKWQKELHERYNTRAKMKLENVKKAAEIHKVCFEVRKQSGPTLEERISHHLKQLELNYPTTIEKPEEEEEEEEEEEVPELTPPMIEVIEDALDGRNPGQVLVDKFNIQITRRDIATLSGLNWLNDEVINFYMNLLMERGKNDNYLNVYAFNTFFYPKLVKMGYSSVRRWTKKVDVFSHDLLLVPVHLGMHWCLATIDLRTKRIAYYDSMLGDNERCLEALIKYLESEHQDKKQSSFDSSGWTLENVKDIPQQMNGSDCGMFACKFSEYLSRDAKITFDQQHMPYFRRRMIYEIVSAKLL